MSADEPAFTDSNVFLYTIDLRDPAKQARAHEWIDALWVSGAGRLSWQVIHEFYANALRLGATKAAARKNAELMAQWRIAAPGLSSLQRAWHWVDSARISFWDALIVAAAEDSGCAWLISEDFQHARKFGEVTVVNPFAASPREFGFSPAPRN
jgi:predicted nucleic acid-binding protein